MPTNVNVTLDVRNFSSGGQNGYTDTTASNGNTYSYKYTGGSDSHGDVYEHDRGTAIIYVTIRADPRYHVNDVTFVQPAGHPAEFSKTITGATTVTITDLNDSVGAGSFCVQVLDTVANCTVPCDPIIDNRPN